MNTIFCNLTPCNLAEILQRFYGICNLHLVRSKDRDIAVYSPAYMVLYPRNTQPSWSTLRESKISHSNIHGLPPSHSNFHGLQHFVRRGSLNRAGFKSDACALRKVEVVVMALDGNMKQCALAVQVWLVLLWGLPRTPRHVGRTPATFRHLGEYSPFCSLYRGQTLD